MKMPKVRHVEIRQNIGTLWKIRGEISVDKNKCNLKRRKIFNRIKNYGEGNFTRNF